jgi:hypothetical protein
VTAHFGDGTFGEMPKDNEPNVFVSPFAELEVTGDFGSRKASFQLLCPIFESQMKAQGK